MSWFCTVLFGGVGIGVVSIISPLYISEVSVAQYRGRLVSLYQLAVTVGFFGRLSGEFPIAWVLGKSCGFWHGAV